VPGAAPLGLGDGARFFSTFGNEEPFRMLFSPLSGKYIRVSTLAQILSADIASTRAPGALWKRLKREGGG
jgi:hypothetical protein